MRAFGHVQDLETSKSNVWHRYSLLVCYPLSPVPYYQFLHFQKILYLYLKKKGGFWAGVVTVRGRFW